MRRVDLEGQKFGRWSVLEFSHTDKHGKSYFKCRCTCGREKAVSANNLRRGKTKSCDCIRIEIITNRKYTKKERKMISERQKGNKNPNYNPNLTDKDRVDRRGIPGYKEWRTAVYELDNYTCQICGDSKGGNLIVHHIESYRSSPELRTEVLNGITLCKDCHKDFHHQYGYGDNTRAQLIEFLKGENNGN